MGQTKRQVGTLQWMRAALRCVPHDRVFIDDLPWNVERAESEGVQSHRFTSTAALREFLAREDL
jgi:hypothetical protein